MNQERAQIAGFKKLIFCPQILVLMHITMTEDNKDIDTILDLLRKSTTISDFALQKCGLNSYLHTFNKMTKVDQRKALNNSLTFDMRSELMRAAVATKDMDANNTYEWIRKEYTAPVVEKASPYEARPAQYNKEESPGSNKSTSGVASSDIMIVGGRRYIGADEQRDFFKAQAKILKAEKKQRKAAEREQEEREQEERERIEEEARLKRETERRQHQEAEVAKALAIREHDAFVAKQKQDAENARIKAEQDEAARTEIILEILPVLTQIYKRYPNGNLAITEEQSFILAGILGMNINSTNFDKNNLCGLTRLLFNSAIPRLTAFHTAIRSIKQIQP